MLLPKRNQAMWRTMRQALRRKMKKNLLKYLLLYSTAARQLIAERRADPLTLAFHQNEKHTCSQTGRALPHLQPVTNAGTHLTSPTDSLKLQGLGIANVVWLKPSLQTERASMALRPERLTLEGRNQQAVPVTACGLTPTLEYVDHEKKLNTAHGQQTGACDRVIRYKWRHLKRSTPVRMVFNCMASPASTIANPALKSPGRPGGPPAGRGGGDR